MSTTLELTETLLKIPSITPDDQGCQALLIARLEPLGFYCETLLSNGVTNLWAVKYGQKGKDGKLFVFAGHTDVVPPGDLNKWLFPPFAAQHHEGRLYGRGASDMKTSIAAFITAIEKFLKLHPHHQESIGLLITSDEEGIATDGTIKIVQQLAAQGKTIDYCLVGEPTCSKVFGDTIKNGRRGSLSGELIIKGKQGHVAYPHLADNPIHKFAPALAELTSIQWDQGNEHFPPTTWQVSNINAGIGATNIIPANIKLSFNFRFSTEVTVEFLKKQIHAILDKHHLDYTIDWFLSGLPFLTPLAELSIAVKQAILEETGVTAEFSTTGGTSDGRFIAQICPQVIEFGPTNRSIHKVNEYIELSEIESLKNIYCRILEHMVV